MATIEDPIKDKLKEWHAANCSGDLLPVDALCKLVSIVRELMAQEREACAMVAEGHGESYSKAALRSHAPLMLMGRADIAFQITYAIRARGRRADPMLYQQAVGRAKREAFDGKGE